jgi:hypothetical protein
MRLVRFGSHGLGRARPLLQGVSDPAEMTYAIAID